VSTPPSTYHVHAEVAAGGRATVTAGNQTIPIDATWAAAEPPGSPGPAELLAGAFAACLMKNLERSSALLSFSHVVAGTERHGAQHP
jgi:organic hydroperoxide reductase OsmC/OhrA